MSRISKQRHVTCVTSNVRGGSIVTVRINSVGRDIDYWSDPSGVIRASPTARFLTMADETVKELYSGTSLMKRIAALAHY
jgi:hypothetical protein